MDDLNKMKVTELKQALKDRGLQISGTKPELVKRLSEALGAAADSSDAGLEDSIQGIDEILNEDTSPAFSKKTNVSDSASTEVDKSAEATPIPPASEVPPANVGEKESELSKEDALDRIAKPDEVSKLSEAERLKLRADKFGIVSDKTKKEIRAQRFGIQSSGDNILAGTQDVDLDKLKKRAERFGAVVSTSLTKVEEDERKRKRAERFGGVTAQSKSTSNIVSSDEIEAKKRKRAERFGLAT